MGTIFLSIKLIRDLTCHPEMIPDEMLEFKVIWRREDEEEIYRQTNNPLERIMPSVSI